MTKPEIIKNRSTPASQGRLASQGQGDIPGVPFIAPASPMVCTSATERAARARNAWIEAISRPGWDEISLPPTPLFPRFSARLVAWNPMAGGGRQTIRPARWRWLDFQIRFNLGLLP